MACLPFCPHFHSERREDAIPPVSDFSHPSGQGKARPFLPNDPVSDLAGAVLLIEEIDDPDETPGILPSDREQVLPSRVGRKIEFLQRLRISADKGLQHFFVVGDVDKVVLFVLLLILFFSDA